MACAEPTDPPTPTDGFDTHLSTEYRGLDGYAYQAADIWSKLPPGTPISIAALRNRLHVGRHIASRVLRELTAAGLAAAQRVRDTATGRLLGRSTIWHGTTREATTPPPPDDPSVRALRLLGSLGAVDSRLAFRPRELRTLVPHVLARYAEGDTDADLRAGLTKDLPPQGRRIKPGLLQYRLTTRPATAPPVEPPRPPAPRPLVECADCGHPNRTLLPGSLCGGCIEKAKAAALAQVVDTPATKVSWRARLGPLTT